LDSLVTKENAEQILKKDFMNIVQKVKDGRSLNAQERKIVSQAAGLTELDSEENLPEVSSIHDKRNHVLSRHYGGPKSMLEKLSESGRTDFDSMALALIEEMVIENDKLLASEEIVAEEGNLRDASVISSKRLEGLDRTYKAVSTLRELNKDHSIDLESPSVRLLVTYVFHCFKESLDILKLDDDLKDAIFQTLETRMTDWKKEFRSRIREMEREKE